MVSEVGEASETEVDPQKVSINPPSPGEHKKRFKKLLRRPVIR
jgi:hypothetical protein